MYHFIDFFFFLTDFIFFRAVLGSQQKGAECTEVSIYSPPPHTGAPTTNIPHQMGHCYNQWANTDTSEPPKVHS